MYTLFPSYVRNEADGSSIPLDEGNALYQVFLEWCLTNEPAQPEAPNHSELVERAKVETRIQRQPIISVLDGLQSSAIVKGETSRALAIETAKQGLRDITDTDLSSCVTYEDMRLKVKARYAEIATALPADIRKAFSEAIN